MQTLDIIQPHNSPILEVESGLWQQYALISNSQEASFWGHKHILALTYPKSLRFLCQSRWTKGSWSEFFAPLFDSWLLTSWKGKMSWTCQIDFTLGLAQFFINIWCYLNACIHLERAGKSFSSYPAKIHRLK